MTPTNILRWCVHVQDGVEFSQPHLEQWWDNGAGGGEWRDIPVVQIEV